MLLYFINDTSRHLDKNRLALSCHDRYRTEVTIHPATYGFRAASGPHTARLAFHSDSQLGDGVAIHAAPHGSSGADYMLFLSRLAAALLECTDNESAVVHDYVLNQSYSREEWSRKDLSSFQVTDHTMVYGDLSGPDFAWLTTEGMEKFACPDFEWYWSPAESSHEGARLLNEIMDYAVCSGRQLKAGETMRIQSAGLTVRLTGSGARAGNVLRVQRVTTGPKGVAAFRAIAGARNATADQHTHLGLKFQLAGRLEEAQREYQAALEAEPDQPDRWNNAGFVLLAQNRPGEAIRYLRRAIALDIENALAQTNLGNAYFQLGRLEEAAAAYQTAVAAQPSYAMPHRNLALLHHLQGRLLEAISHCERYFALTPKDSTDPDAHYNFGVMLSESGKQDEALAQFQLAIGQRPAFPKALNNAGLIHFSSGRLDQAVELFRSALDADPAFTLARFNLASALAAKGDYDDAAREYENLLQSEPEHAEASSNLGVLYTAQGKAEKAIPILEQLVARYPKSPTFRFNLAIAYQAQQRHQEAAREFAAVLALEPPDTPRALRARGELEALRAS